MKRQRRKRSIRRRGVQHVGELLSILVNEIEQDETAEARKAAQNQRLSGAPATTADGGIDQSTFAFYQTAGS